MRRDDRGVVLGLYRSGPDRGLIERALDLGVRGLDTAYNYRRFTSHRVLARVAGDLLDEFTLSTKVGFFPSSDPAACAEHSLDPSRLRVALERSVEDLGRTPDVVFLHNPERTLASASLSDGRDLMAAACLELAHAVATGLCGRWGVASWDTRPVAAVLGDDRLDARPDVLLTRSGLSVADPVLTASEQLSAVFEVPPGSHWGMSPFGGSADDRAWRTGNFNVFLQPGQRYTSTQAAFRLAFAVPPVTRVAVGTSNPDHLQDLAEAISLRVNEDALSRYRRLIRDGPADQRRPEAVVKE